MRIKNIIILVLCIAILTGCGHSVKQAQKIKNTNSKHEYACTEYTYSEYTVKRNGLKLHLDCMTTKGAHPKKDILLIHGVTYSSHEFDVDYKDYSLVRKLAREGYAVWRLDIAGFGQSEQVKDGFMPDSDYAAEDIAAATQKIIKESGHSKIDILGWSWGTVTTSRFAAKHPEQLNKVVLYAPILYGIGEYKVTEPFHHNDWNHAADDFQKTKDGKFDYSVAEKQVIDIFCSNCWRYDGEESPNGGRRDACVSKDIQLIDLTKLTNPTLIICGDNDPYLYNDKVDNASKLLPRDSKVKVFHGASHMLMVEKPYYHQFQKQLIDFLNR